MSGLRPRVTVRCERPREVRTSSRPMCVQFPATLARPHLCEGSLCCPRSKDLAFRVSSVDELMLEEFLLFGDQPKPSFRCLLPESIHVAMGISIVNLQFEFDQGAEPRCCRRGAGNGRSSRKVLTFTPTLHYKRTLYKRLDFKGVRSFRGEAGKGVRCRAPL